MLCNLKGKFYQQRKVDNDNIHEYKETWQAIHVLQLYLVSDLHILCCKLKL